MPAIFLRLTLLLSFVAASFVALAGEQYRSRMYIDIEQDATENVALSVSELEKQLDTLQDNTARTSAEKFLAQHYAAEKDYPKAIAKLEDALKRPGQNDNARRDLLGELSRLYVLQKDYDHAAITLQQYLDMQPPEDAELFLLLAQIDYKNKKYVESTAALDKALMLEKHPSDEQLQTALAIYYGTGNYARCAQVMQQRVEQDINNATLWQQWVSLELKAGNPSQALTVLSLAWEKSVPFRDQDILLLCDLYTINKIPARGARVLEAAMKSGRVPNSSAINERLFRLWLQAGDRDKAQLALEKAAQQGDDKDLQLHLAQLYMEKEQWQAMQGIVLKACTTPLPDALVSRANLLLGISQLKLGATELARRSFINATLIGGENDKAGQWLAYMKAEPATEREKIGIAGPCFSNSTRSIWTASLPSAKASHTSSNDDDDSNDASAAIASTAAGKPPVTSNASTFMNVVAQKQANVDAVVNSKTTPSQQLYLAELTLHPDEFASKILSTAIHLGITISRNGGTINGSMHFIYNNPPDANGKITVRFGFPVSGNPKNSSGFRLTSDKGFKCVWRDFHGKADDVANAIAQLYLDAKAKGYTFTGESRQIAGKDNSVGSSEISLELQLGVEP